MNGKKRANGVISFEFVGQVLTWTIDGQEPLSLDMSKVSEQNRIRAAIHGLKQRVSDGAALSADPETGRAPSAGDKRAAMARIVEHLESGATEWNLRASGVRVSGRLLLNVLCEAYPEKPRASLATWLKSKDSATRTALLAEPRLKAIADRMIEEATAGVDTETLEIELEMLE